MIDIRAHWVGRFAGIEVMRRLIGVAQLPIPVHAEVIAESGTPDTFRSSLLARSCAAMLAGDFEQLSS